MIPVRYRVLTIAMLAVAGCAPTSYSQPGYNVQPAAVTYDGGYGGNAGYVQGGGGGYDNGPVFHPSRNLTCDRARDLCYDRFGLDYYATSRYFGERAANRTVRKYGEQVFLFAPKRGINCDRRTRSCSDAGGIDVDLTEDYFGNKAEHKARDWLAADSFKPENSVTCVTATKVCSDKKGPSITLTQVYFGRAAAQDLAEVLGPGAPGYLRVPDLPAANPAPAPVTAAPQAGSQPGQSVPPVASAEPLPAPEPGAPLPVAAPSAEGGIPPVEDTGSVAQPEQPVDLPAPEPQDDVAAPQEPETAAAEPVAPTPVPEPAPIAEAAPVQAEPVQAAQPDGNGGAGACADPQGCVAQ
jgi:hypothetical protein